MDGWNDQIKAFWEVGKRQAAPARIPGYGAPLMEPGVPPPVVSLDPDPATCDHLLRLVLDGTKTALSTPEREFEANGIELPSKGSMQILTDSAGAARVLTQTIEVDVVPFYSVGAEHAVAEADGDGSLEAWRHIHRKAFAEDAGENDIPDDLSVVLERFMVIYQN